jgi:hypothetical protein
MDYFRVIVLSVAIVILVLVLTIIGILLAKQGSSKTYPPEYTDCPDYWTFNTDSSMCQVPSYGLKTSLNLGGIYNKAGALLLNSTNTPGFKRDASNNVFVDFNNSSWAGTCSKKKWSNSNGIVWDGISNYNTC